MASSSYERIAGLPLEIESLSLEGLELRFSEEFTRQTTLVQLHGPGGEVGVGEDVVYDGLDHVALQAEGGALDLAGSYTLDSFAQRLEEVELWPAPPVREASVDYRRWAFESSALDLALQQAGQSLADALGRELRPVNYVVSMRLEWFDHEGPDRPDKLLALLERYPGTRFKLDPTNGWTPELVQTLVDTGAVDSLDLKGCYKDTPVDVETDPELYAMVIESFPDAWLEDPDVNDETRPLLDPVAGRITWDAPDPFGGRRAGPPLAAAHGEHQALPLRSPAPPVRHVRLVRERGRGRLRRRPDRAGPGPRPHPVPGLALPPRHAERHRPGRLQPPGGPGRAAAEPAGAARRRDRLSLGGLTVGGQI